MTRIGALAFLAVVTVTWAISGAEPPSYYTVNPGALQLSLGGGGAGRNYYGSTDSNSRSRIAAEAAAAALRNVGKSGNGNYVSSNVYSNDYQPPEYTYSTSIQSLPPSSSFSSLAPIHIPSNAIYESSPSAPSQSPSPYSSWGSTPNQNQGQAAHTRQQQVPLETRPNTNTGHAFKSRNPGHVNLPAQVSWFYSDKENAIYKVARISLDKTKGIYNPQSGASLGSLPPPPPPPPQSYNYNTEQSHYSNY